MANKVKIVYQDRGFGIKFGYARYKGYRYYFYNSTNVALILPLLSGGRIVLEKQYRPQIKKYIYELPAGHIGKSEKSRYAAARELNEETGYTASKLSLLLEFYSTPGMMNEKVYAYLAEGLTPGKINLDGKEELSVKIVTMKKAMQMIRKNQIVDAKTVATLLYYKAFVK